MIDEVMFVDECRLHYKILSDDQIRMIYRLYRDEWSRHINEEIVESNNRGSIFNVLFRLSEELLRIKNNIPLVKFRHLFRWREITQILGEDLIVGAFLANRDRERISVYDNTPDFSSYPTVLHNDNPNLEYIFKNLGLCELHSHLGAATDNFTISWVCMMNHPGECDGGFREVAMIQDPSRHDKVYQKFKDAVTEACSIRLFLWQFLISGQDSLSEKPLPASLFPHIEALEKSISNLRTEENDYDYIYNKHRGYMDVFSGERLFLYLMFSKIIRDDDYRLHELFFRYVLRKNYVRRFLVQVNDNNGFSNFKRFQDLKSKLLTSNYRKLLKILPVWEAKNMNYTIAYEARVTPHNTPKQLGKLYESIIETCDDAESKIDLSIIYHFLKKPDNGTEDFKEKDYVLRDAVKGNSQNLRDIKKSSPFGTYTTGIDAASSELFCRPEAFAQAFRYLKEHGYSATFHAGEDFYDIADGLRAIDESIGFLQLETGDRIGHAIALGLDPKKFYQDRHHFIALPMQWMLDNVVWLYFYARKNNILIEPETENFLLSTYRSLIIRIGYVSVTLPSNHTSPSIDIYDYYQSMLLRSDNPGYYSNGRFEKISLENLIKDKDDWNYYGLLENDEVQEIREYNRMACNLYSEYHFSSDIKRNGNRIKSFKVPESYTRLIYDIQCRMMRDISKQRIGIECCPSSNFRIGHLETFDNHPIFRFMPVRECDSHYPLAVTVNTDDLGIFATSLPNEFSLLALALLKKKDKEGNHIYSSQEVYDWIERIVKNGHKYHFAKA